MTTNYPTSLDSFTNPVSTDSQQTVDHAGQHSNINDAVEALEAKVGINNSTDISSIDYKLRNVTPLTTKGDLVTSNGNSNVRLPVGADGYMLVADSAETTGLKYIPPTSGGTVTDVSVVSANGFGGSVANSSTSPDITITTSITGVLKGNGTAISAATPDTDYLTPTGNGSGLTGVLPAGIISPFGGVTAPTGWLLADGSTVSRTTYAGLFAVISTTYGSGDGSTTFHLPDLRGKFPVGRNTFDTSFNTLGETGGEKEHTLTESEMPTHSHGVLSSSGGGSNSGSVQLDSGVFITGTYATTSSNGYSIIQSKGSSAAHNNLPPYITLNYIIKT